MFTPAIRAKAAAPSRRPPRARLIRPTIARASPPDKRESDALPDSSGARRRQELSPTACALSTDSAVARQPRALGLLGSWTRRLPPATPTDGCGLPFGLHGPFAGHPCRACGPPALPAVREAPLRGLAALRAAGYCRLAGCRAHRLGRGRLAAVFRAGARRGSAPASTRAIAAVRRSIEPMPSTLKSMTLRRA